MIILCWWRYARWRGCAGRLYNPCYRRAVAIPACAPQGAGSAAGMTAEEGRARRTKGGASAGAHPSARLPVLSSSVIPASEPESWVALCGRVRGRCRHCLRHRLAHGCRLGGRHDGGEGTRREQGALRRRCVLLRCRSYYYCVIPASERESWVALCGVLCCR